MHAGLSHKFICLVKTKARNHDPVALLSELFLVQDLQLFLFWKMWEEREFVIDDQRNRVMSSDSMLPVAHSVSSPVLHLEWSD